MRSGRNVARCQPVHHYEEVQQGLAGIITDVIARIWKLISKASPKGSFGAQRGDPGGA
jgi:hypothetical protein